MLLLSAAETEVKRPDNIAVLAGSTVVFQCTSSANNQTRWDYYRHGVNQPSTIFNGERVDSRVSSRFTVDVASCMKRKCDLTIRDVQTTDAGFFVCFEPSRSNRKSAALVVLGDYNYHPCYHGHHCYHHCGIYIALLIAQRQVTVNLRNFHFQLYLTPVA